ncbi:MAG: hypothetical protein CW342_14485 [Thermoactinomycetaceae bacterium]|nr:hypothetical protein [Bacillota bacterium]MBO2534054.1 hypothetical protein [Thermoactinomycetaceae bacterium]
MQTVPLLRGIPLGAVRESGGSRRSVDRIDGRYPVQRWIGDVFSRSKRVATRAFRPFDGGRLYCLKEGSPCWM